MNPTRTLLWMAFILLSAAMVYNASAFAFYGVPGMLSMQLTLNATRSQQILQTWSNTSTSLGNLFPFARYVIWLDFIFIPVYVALIQHYSTNRLRQERILILNTLLRLNLLLIVLAGILDIVENVLLLYNLRYSPRGFIFTGYITLIKWILIIWTTLVWLLSKIKNINIARSEL